MSRDFPDEIPIIARARSARAREELKYAHLARRETDTVRANREYFAAYAASIEPDPVPAPSGARLELAPRYADRRPER